MSTFASLLAKAPATLEPFGYKRAQADGIDRPDGEQLEQDFARLAYMFLQDRAAPLMKYLLGFEIVNKDDDGSRAVGIFGLKLGKDYYYIPAFFLNNQIKGVDSIFSKRTNTFIPLQEDWINYLVNRQTIELGSAAQNDALYKDFENPNYHFLSHPPVSPSGPLGKVAQELPVEAVVDALKGAGRAAAPVVDDIAIAADPRKKSKQDGDGKPLTLKAAWELMHDQLVDALEKDAEFGMAWAGFVSKLSRQPIPFEKTAENSDLLRWLSDAGGPRAVSSFLGTLTGNSKYANACLSFYPSVESVYVHEFAPGLMPKSASKIEVLTKVTDYMDGKSRQRLVRDGFTIEDSRDAESKTEAFDLDYERHFTNPDRAGTYKVLLASGATAEAWVFPASTAETGGAMTVVHPQKRLFIRAEPGAVYVRNAATGDRDQLNTDDAYAKAVDFDDMELKRKYLLIDDKGNCAGPLTPESVISEKGKRVRMRVSWGGTYGIVKRPTYGRDFETLHWKRGGRFDAESCRGNRQHTYIEFADHRGPVKESGDTLIVPSNWKALALFPVEAASDDTPASYEARRAGEDLFKLGTLADLAEAMTKAGFHKLTVASDDGNDYYFRVDDNFCTRPYAYKSAYVSLVQRLGLSVDTAETLLKEAQANRKARRLVKFAQAQSPSPFVGVAMPQPQEQIPSQDPYTGIPMYPGPYEQDIHGSYTGLPRQPTPNQYGINLGGEAEMDVGAQNLAVQAGEAGQKRVFDHASIGGLAKIYDTGTVIDSYIPELMKSLDRLGRILFLYYWKNKDFAERYGTDALAEMEDLLRSVFKSYGDLVLTLRKKSIDSDSANTIDM